jgi:two-component system, OmpR family, sensor histidine kinase KdpD
LGQRLLRLLLSLVGVALVTVAGHILGGLNVTTIGFAYLLIVLIAASLWGFFEAAAASIVATLAYNFYFLPPVGQFAIADPQNWVALFTFLTTSLIASRLSAKAKNRALDAIARQQDLERLYTFSRAILLIDNAEPFPKQLVRKLAEIFELIAVVLYERHDDEFYRGGPSDLENLDEQLRDAALQGTSFADPKREIAVTAVRLGSQPIAGLAVRAARMPDAVLQGIANLVAIGLERARAQELASQVEAGKHSEKLRTALLDAMAHEFKTPLTSVIAVTSSLRANPEQPAETKAEMIKIADEEAKHLQVLIGDTVEMARLDTANIRVHVESSDVNQIVRDVITSMRNEIDDRPMDVSFDDSVPQITIDRRLVGMAIKQILGNALKYSPPDTPVTVRVHSGNGVTVSVTDRGKGIPVQEQSRIFDRLYRSPSVEKRIPGSGLGLSIAQNIVRAHHGDLVVTSRPGETTFQLMLPPDQKGSPP